MFSVSGAESPSARWHLENQPPMHVSGSAVAFTAHHRTPTWQMEVSSPKPIPKYLLELPHTRDVTVDLSRDGSATCSSLGAGPSNSATD